MQLLIAELGILCLQLELEQTWMAVALITPETQSSAWLQEMKSVQAYRILSGPPKAKDCALDALYIVDFRD